MRILFWFIAISLIIFFSMKIFLTEQPQETLLSREDISSQLITTEDNDQPPHYNLIGQRVRWFGDIKGYNEKADKSVQLKFLVNTESFRAYDTILVSKISNMKEFYRQNSNKALWFEGSIVRIDPDKPGQEIVYVNGNIVDGKFD